MEFHMVDTETTQHPSFPVPRACPFQSAKAAEPGNTDQRPLSRVTLPTGATAWLVTGHSLVRQLLIDQRISVDRSNPGFPHLVPMRIEKNMGIPLIGLDPPEHTAHRRMLINEFTVKRMHSLQPRIQKIVDTCIDKMLCGDRPADLVQALSLPVPSMVVCELLGVPDADRPVFNAWARTGMDRGSSAEEVRAAHNGLRAYFGELVSRKEKELTDDVLSRTILKYREAGTYDHTYMVIASILLLNAGHITAGNMISLAVVALLENPASLAEIKADPALTPKAIEELLRYFSVVDQTIGRVALADIEIGDEVIRAGEGVILSARIANRDGEVFENPDRLDISRSDAHRHVAFGYGNHNCLGQNLARVELEIVLNTLFARIPELRLAKPAMSLPYKDQEQVYGIFEVPVTW
jgi:cytochrome P450